ncbi:MAG: cyclic nucleotide-binding domain-containing protein, partial [Candidatus Dadabacteria bacterium]|nr:cyclic nucleotide-binding domain-containing protein [Candidatus Dadabacteria bacterium]
EYPRKQTIFHENDVGEYLYIMLEGLAEVYVRSNATFRDISIASLKPGDFFGDGAATSEEEKRHTATIKTALDSKVFRIHKQHVLNAIKEATPAEPLPSNEVSELLSAIPIFKGLNDDEIRDTTTWAKAVNYKKNDLIHEPGMTADTLFVLLDGELQIFVLDTNGKKHIINSIDAGQYFG